ncbi:MAG: hypothetical protein M0Z30_10930 [Actinomycetota bacterium]|nr:hypothetical protein [Actinomycetota bacterium]
MEERRASLPNRAVVTMVDQCVASGSNFAVAVIIARIAGPAGLGAYSLAYASWLFVSSIHRAVITDPMAIHGDARDPAGARSNLRHGFAAEASLGICAGAVVALLGLVLIALHQRTFGLSQVAVAGWIPFLLIQDYWRWVGFMRGQPGKALANDLVFDAVQGVGFAFVLVAHIHSASLAIAAWGLGALAGTLYGAWQFRVVPALLADMRWIRPKWSTSRWLLATCISSWGLTQLYAVLTAAILGPVGLGGLKAAQGLVSGPAFVLVQAGGSLGLPEASRAYDERGPAGLHRVTRLVTAAGVASVGGVLLIVVFFGRHLLTVLYGARFTRYAPAADVIALAYLLTSFSLGAILEVKATRRVKPLFTLSIPAVIASVVAVLLLAPPFRVTGAAGAYAIGTAVYVAGLLIAVRPSRTAEVGAVRSGDGPGDRQLGAARLHGGEWPGELARRLEVLDAEIQRARSSLAIRLGEQLDMAQE